MDGKGPFGKEFNVEAQVVNGHMPTCAQRKVYSYLFIKLYIDVLHAELILEQKINGKISYMPHINKSSSVLIVTTLNNLKMR